MIDFVDKTSEQKGTPINTKNLMAMQGFIGNTIVFNSGSVVETNQDGQTKTTIFNSDGSISEIFEGDKIITKTTIFNSDGSITEVIS